MSEPECKLCPKGDPAVAFITDAEGNGFYFFSVALQVNNIVDYRNDQLEFEDIYKDNGCFVYGGDTVDKRDSDRLIVKKLNQFKKKYPHRVFLVLGNRDINKLRIYVELDKDHANTSRLPRPFDVSKVCYWDKNVYCGDDEENLPKNSYPSWLKKQGDTTHCWLNMLKWTLECTMGAPAAFDYRRQEMARENDVEKSVITDQEIYDDFFGSVDPNGNDPWMLEYIMNGQIAARVANTIFVHGALSSTNLRQLPTGCSGPTDTLNGWLHSLNSWARKLVVDFQKNPKKMKKERTLGPLLDYGLPCVSDDVSWVVPDFHHKGKSVVVANWLINGNPEPLPDEVYTFLAENKVDIVTGHQPHGDCPMIIVGNGGDPALEEGHAHMPVVISADTSYSDNARAAHTSLSIFVSHIEVNGILANGCHHGYHLARTRESRALTTIGKQLPDKSWVKTVSQGKLVLVRGEGYRLHTRMLDEYYVRRLLHPTTFPKSLGPFGTLSLDESEVSRVSVDRGALRWSYECSDSVQYATFCKVYGNTQGGTSPISVITLTNTALNAASIPKNAKHFCFMYPLQPSGGEQNAMDAVNFVDPAILLMTAGGYVYFDDDFKVVQVNAMEALGGGHLQFDLPKAWNPAWTKELAEKERFCPITLHGFAHSWYAWITPGEVIGDKECSSHGAFVFLAHDPKQRFPSPAALASNIFFEVVGSEKHISNLQDHNEVFDGSEPHQLVKLKKKKTIPVEAQTLTSRPLIDWR